MRGHFAHPGRELSKRALMPGSSSHAPSNNNPSTSTGWRSGDGAPMPCARGRWRENAVRGPEQIEPSPSQVLADFFGARLATFRADAFAAHFSARDGLMFASPGLGSSCALDFTLACAWCVFTGSSAFDLCYCACTWRFARAPIADGGRRRAGVLTLTNTKRPLAVRPALVRMVLVEAQLS